VKPDLLHSPMVIDINLRTDKSTHGIGHSYRKFADGNNTLYDILSNYDWSQVCNNISVGAAVHYAMDQSIPRGFVRKTEYPY
jgi:hypothetical protein